MGNRKRAADIVIIVVLVCLVLFFLFPMYFSFISAFKSNGEILRNALAFPSHFYVESFIFLWSGTNFPAAMVNSVFLTMVSVALMVLVIPMAAYAIERKNTRIYNLLYLFFLAGMMIPFQVSMIPLFKQMQIMGLYGNLAGPIVVYISGSVSFGILLYASFFKGVPREIEEAAEIDGCSRTRTFWQIVFPLLAPCTASMIVLNGLAVWNDFLLPLLMLPSDKPKTIIVEIYTFVGKYATRWDIVFAGTVLSMIPVMIVFLALQKYFVKGLVAGATKG